MPPSDSPPLLTILRTRFGLDAFRTGQAEILSSVLAGKDTVAVMPTGSGKSLCYQLPALARGGIVIVVSPLISLMNDQVAGLKRLGLPAGCIHSAQTEPVKKSVFANLEAADSFVLYLSPERVQKAGFSHWIRGRPITLFAIDEAHCISQWGHDFRPDYAELSLLRRERPDVPLALFTATATPQVVSDISRQIGLRDPEIHVHGFYRPNLYIQVADCRNEGHKLAVLRQALRKTPEGRVIVYCGTRRGTEEVAMALSAEFPGTTYYHAGMDPEERSRTQEAYHLGQTRILVATNAFGMGIDHPDVRLVVHHQMPANLESYYQEIGRAGRDGKPSTCLLLYARKDKGLQSYFIRESGAPPQIIHHRWNTLAAMIQFAEGGECRHGGILTYFRDTQRISACGHCDICAPDASAALEPASLREAAGEAATRKGARKRRTAADDAETAPVTDPAQLRRMEALRAWRKDYAKQNDVPAFVVFSDKTLRELILKNPRGPKELLEVYGIGEHKVDTFGEAVLSVLRAEETP